MSKLQKSDYEKWNIAVRALIAKGMEQALKTDGDVAKLLDISESTWFRKKKEPALLTTYELFLLKTALRFSSVELLEIYHCAYKLQLA